MPGAESRFGPSTEEMMPETKQTQRKPIYLPPGCGRSYPMGRISSVFKADGAETGRTFSVSEWWLEPNTKGPPAHSHDEDHAWYVIEGTMSVQVGGQWTDAVKGAFLLIPGRVVHTFENRTMRRAGILSFNNDAGFEDQMPSISEWFARNPPEDA